MPEKAGCITEQSREIPVTGSYDVLVAGGGIAGVAAAVAAARNGASVCLLEKNFTLGGLATAGNVTIWLPICDGMGRQVMAGLPEELLKLSVADLTKENHSAKFVGVPECWKPGGDIEVRKKSRYQVHFNPTSYLLALEKLILDSGVTLLYDTRVCSVQTRNNRIDHVIVENKSGRNAIAVQVVIDATGDADVCFLAGEETESLDSNVPAGWFYHLQDDGLWLAHMSNSYSPRAKREGAQGPFFRGDNAEEVTAQITESHRLIREKMQMHREDHPESEIILLPTLPCFRMTRRLVGTVSLNENDIHTWAEDTVGLTGDWRKRGPVYSIPWATLRGVKTTNLLTSGRCISADTTVWDVTRAIPTCALTGTATGVGAAMAAKKNEGNVWSLNVSALQEKLQSQGALLDPALVEAAGEY